MTDTSLRLSVAGLITLLAGCAAAPGSQRAPVLENGTGGSVPVEERGTAAAPGVSPTQSEASVSGSAAVQALISRADQSGRARDWERAAATLERALRIEPRNPILWNRLAEVRLHQAQPRQTVQLARKSNSLAGRDSLLMARNWRLIGQARQLLGDERGAAEARQRADALMQ